MRERPRASKQEAPASRARPRQLAPDWFVRRIAQEAQELGDTQKALQSVLTRCSKVFFTAEQTFVNVTQEEVINRLDDARRRTSKHAGRIKKRSTSGKKNYMPFFISCFIISWGCRQEELVFIDSDEPLYQDSSISDFV